MRATLAQQFRGQFANVHNFNPERNLAKLRSAKQRVLLGRGRARIAVVGDSQEKGLGAGTSGTFNAAGAEPFCVPTRLAAYLNVLGIPASAHSAIAGFGVTGGGTGLDNAAQLTAYDTRISAGAGWDAINNGNYTFGGQGWANDTTTNALAFTPAVSVDTFIISWGSASGFGLGVFSYDIDGGTATQVNEDVAEAYNLLTISTSLASHTCNIKRVSAFCGFNGWFAYNSTVPAVDIINGGWSGSTSGQWNDTSFLFAPRPALTALAADLYLIQLGGNDWETGVSQATYLANVQALITAAKAGGGDVILLMPLQTGATATPTTQQQFYRSLVTLANNNNVMLVDWQRKGISYAVQNAAGRMNDTLHGKAVLYDDQAAFLARLLAAA